MRYLARIYAALMAAAFLLTANGCIIVSDDNSGNVFPCLSGEGPMETVDIGLPPFTGVELRSDVDVFLSQGPVQEVELRAHANLIDELILEVDGGDLEIRARNCIASGSRPQVFITMPQLGRVVNSSAAPVTGESAFVSGKLEISVPGSGDVNLATIADAVKANISGSGNILLEGEAAALNVKITGSGNFMGFGLAAVSANVLISGSGDAEVKVEDFLEALLSGSGDVFFKGNPALEVSLTGSGKVFDAN